VHLAALLCGWNGCIKARESKKICMCALICAFENDGKGREKSEKQTARHCQATALEEENMSTRKGGMAVCVCACLCVCARAAERVGTAYKLRGFVSAVMLFWLFAIFILQFYRKSTPNDQ